MTLLATHPMTLAIDPSLLTGFLMAMVRAVAWLFVVPPFGTRLIPTPVKVGFAAALGVVAAPGLAEQRIPIELGPLVAAAAFQVLVGVTLGFIVLLLIQAVQSAGEMIDIFGGLTVAPAFDPMSGQQASGFARFYQMLASTLLFTLGGHLLVVRGFLESFRALPLGGLALDDLQVLLVDNLGRFLVAAVEIAAPLIGVMVLIEVTMGLIARAAPSMNVFLAAMPGKALLAIALIAIALPLLPGAIGALLDQGVSDSLRALGR